MKSIVFLAILVLAAFANEEQQEMPAEFVKVITTENFQSVVKDSPQDVLMEFYAPWCGHCKKLVPTYEELARRVAPNPNLIIAKVDSTQHKIPGVEIRGYPTMKLFKKGDNPTIVDYKSARTVDAFVQFLKENTSHEWVELDQPKSDDL